MMGPRTSKGELMAFAIRRVDYYYATIQGEAADAYKLLPPLAELGIDLLAFTAVPMGPMHTQLSLFPQDGEKLVHEVSKMGIALDGPHPALLVQGDDELGALAEVHTKLHDVNVSAYASSGVADGKGSFGYVIYVRPEDYTRAAAALNL